MPLTLIADSRPENQYSLRDPVTVAIIHENEVTCRHGVIVGRTFSEPPLYDVIVHEPNTVIHLAVPAERLTLGQV